MASGRAGVADFHTHTTASDGTLSPAKLAHCAASRGISVLAVTDHDTVRGLAEAEIAAESLGLTFVRGVELSTRVSRGEVHILGYGIDPHAERLRIELDRFRQSRRTRAETMIERLRAVGVELDATRLNDISDDASVGRPHIARLLIDAGYVSSVQEAFDRFLAQGRPGYVSRESLRPTEAVDLIVSAGGVPVFAHPFSDPDFEERIGELLDAGLRGIEVYYGEYSKEQRSYLASVAQEHGLLRTGGSDYHGPDFRDGRELGSVNIPRDAVDALLAAVAASRGG